MKLIWNWKAVLAKGWSMRWMAATAVLDGAERALPYLDQTLFPPGVFGWLSFVTLFLAAGTRLLQQPEVHHAIPATKDPDAA